MYARIYCIYHTCMPVDVVRVEIGRAGGERLPLDVALSAALMTQLVLEGRCAHTGLGDTIRFKQIQ